jgi:hypothetical protein
MELFIPSLLAIVLAAVIVMFALPRLSPVILGVLALVFLVLAAWNHYTFFGSEYQISTWQLPLVQYAPYVLLSGLVLFMLFFIINFIGLEKSEAAAPIAAMNESVNKVANTAAANVTNAVNTVVNNVKNLTGMNNTRPANNKPANKPANNVRFSQI